MRSDEEIDAVLEVLDPGSWASLTEAAAAAGVSKSTLRSWYRAGKLESRLVPGPNGPQREVLLSAVLGLARVGEKLSRAAMDPATAVAALEQALVRAERRAERAELALRAALERAARAEARLTSATRRTA